jgi:hypothetical protein
MKPILSQAQWLELPSAVRSKLMQVFGIKRSKPTQAILGTFGKCESDGCSDEDIAVLTEEAMQKYLGNYHLTDFFALFTEVLNRFASEEDAPISIAPAEHPIYDRWKQELIRMRDESEKTDLVLKLKHMVWEVFPQPIKHEEPIQTTRANKGSKKRSTA